MNPNIRRPHESKAQFKRRRAAENAYLKRRLKYRSVLWPAANGTYSREQHGELS